MTLYHIGKVIDFRINKGNVAQSFMFENKFYRPVGDSTEITPLLLLLAIMQPILFFHFIEVFWTKWNSIHHCNSDFNYDFVHHLDVGFWKEPLYK